ncbi:JNK-interacting protein 3 isoform X4 [Anoplophora glabripennis]|uniref:JNK-interacting protein 3 isoform X4 n=1 Tax=Anoplophora glabripennis TaxID=217634 RepID=UPI00087395DF|nr:JNK-interacting protein 3 isoform X4 [Anoplophora glabripennis]
MNLEDSGGSLGLGGETVYGTHEDSHVVMSEKVQSLAGSIYQEFERMIARYDEDVVKTLMPLLVNVLECLDAAYQQNQEQDVELELLREDNEQLVTQYEREKGARKTAEQKLLEYEDAAEGERKELAARLEALESIVRMLELKHKNSMDHAGRLEEREAELKKEYAKLHERYTELFKTHVDYMERTKLLHSGQQLANERAEAGRLNSNRINMGRSSGPISFGFASLENAETVDSVPSSPISSTHSSPSFHSELDNSPKEGVTKVERGQATDSLSLENKSMVTSPVSPQAPTTNNSRINTKKEERSGNTLYQELSYHDDGDEDASDITGGWVHPGEYASSVNDNFYGMGKEVENLIMENNELLATKNALNVVKDDLIVKVDELTGEIDMLRDEILSLNVSRTKLKERISELEEELKKLKEANEAKQEADDESDVPMAQRKRFTRVEMARVLMERNQYKERFMELQEAVRWTEMLRASRGDTPFEKHSNKSIWRFFSNLFSSNDRVQRPLVVPHLRYQSSTNQVAPGIKALPRLGHDLIETEMGSDKLAVRKALERREQYRQVRAHVKKEDGRLQAYGWSLPGKVNAGPAGKQSSGGVPVPVPVYCRPLAETTPAMRIWCAAGVNLMGGYTKDGGLMVGGSVFYSEEPKIPSPKRAQSEVESLDKELNNGKEGALLETRLSSLVWICTTTHSASIVTVIDANNPAELLNSFGVCSNHILCIASVPGASPSDYFETVAKVECNNEVNVSKDCPADNVPASGTPPASLKSNEEAATQSGETGGSGPPSSVASSKQSIRNHEEQEEAAALGKVTFVEKDESAINKKDKYAKAQEENCDSGKEALNETCETCDTTLDSIKSEEDRPKTEDPDETKDKQSPAQKERDDQPRETQSQEIMSSVLATMWMGDEHGNIYVHSSVTNWAQCLHTVKMKDAVIAIVHINGRVVVALACGQVAIFKRNSEGEWDLSQYHLVQLGLPHQSVRQLAVVGDKVWCGYRNKIHVLQPHDLQVIHTLEAHPRRESPVRQMAWLGEGVWVSIRLDSTLRLYHAHTYQHLQDVDIEPYVSKMLGTGKLGFSLVRITSLLISSNRLWIGTSNGVIISVPLTEGGGTSGAVVPRGSLPGAGVRIMPVPGSYVPFCTMAHAQLSFHGHRDNVKFFVAVPGNGGMSAASTPSEAMSASVSSVGGQLKQPTAMLVISGGEGYVDFRIGDEMEDSVVSTGGTGFLESAQGSHSQVGELSHLIVWQVSTG